MDGVVARKLVNGGEMVSSGQKLFSIVDGGDIWLNVRVAETKIGRIRQGQDCSSRWTVMTAGFSTARFMK